MKGLYNSSEQREIFLFIQFFITGYIQISKYTLIYILLSNFLFDFNIILRIFVLKVE